ncbi:hypothetical protein CHLRE_05g240550v5 [Chlamydomonas reinhardtii]|uniref:Chlorophyll antenna size regulatory protein n=1 Tax=Chlamydomonas reinhardtii TaxID=3055 RepID=Q8L439_CHLRE|nr:uncharacterized protein CHLRE_05g240550v5 [Chlamydomonas reinhardtii]AAN01224.1 chlorophyll antenna size regulatory protein [Chlamydomonas reinhardtii]AAN01225.1 chlorophyll antenna size regulatory protein [Chlamydomonas reinhardtii]PNW83722.1 hypothetical protein CHLRE_05g240550v5 [Chlamydomonas reinhardtii]|eukprot:XP_001697758.1 predicted protein [Chlamydomonas reinhardtii]
MTFSCSADQTALLKILAHAAKYPSNSVNGVLVGTAKEGGSVEILDAIPLCHTTLTLAPALEIGLAQVESYTHITGSVAIVGYYQSDARFGPGDLPPLGRKIADKVSEHQAQAVVLVLDNKRLEQFCKAQADNPFELFSKDGSKGWKRASADGGELALKNADWKKLREEFFVMFKQLKHRTLHDFEEHLDDAGKDWLNKGFASSVKFLLPGNAL